MLSVKNVRAYYDSPAGTVKAVDGVTLQVFDNEILGIAGESGCGKSTLIKVLYGDIVSPLKIVSGDVEASVKDETGQELVVRGNELNQIWWRQMSYIPQGSMSVLNPLMRIEDQFYDAIPHAYKDRNTRIGKPELTKFLRELELPETVLRAYPHQLSGGMRQRVIVALATFLRPQIVLADEPTTALDVVVQKGILSLITRLQNRLKNSFVIVSHDIAVHYQITHRLAIMYAGKIVEIGKTETIFNHPDHPYTNMLIKSLPRIGDRSRREGIGGAPPSLLNPPQGCRFADHCQLAFSECREIEPPLLQVSADHSVACHLFSTQEMESRTQ